MEEGLNSPYFVPNIKGIRSFPLFLRTFSNICTAESIGEPKSKWGGGFRIIYVLLWFILLLVEIIERESFCWSVGKADLSEIAFFHPKT